MTTRNLPTVIGGLLVTLLLVGFGGPAALGQQSGERQVVSQERYDAWFDELSNWGRWGPDDEMGALNLITPEKRRAAADLVTEGFTVSLASIANRERTIDNPAGEPDRDLLRRESQSTTEAQ